MAFDYSVVEPYVTKFLIMAALMLLDTIGGMLAAWLAEKNFKWEEVPRYLQKFVPYIFGWLVFVFISAIPAEYSDIIEKGLGTAENVVYASIILGIGGSLLGHLAKFGIMSNGLARFGIGDGKKVG